MQSATPVLTNLIRAYVRSGARGSTRGTLFLAQRLKELQAVPITVNGSQRLYVDLRDGLSHMLLAGSPWPSVPWEPDEQAVMRRMVRPGDVAFDVGAHIGLHTVLLAALVGDRGHVHAFEANPDKIAPLAKTVKRLPNATLHPFGLSDREEQAVLFVPEDESMASLADWTDGRVGAVRREPCTLKRLDDLVGSGQIPPPDFIKIDVEGAEIRVLGGARNILNGDNPPIVLYEANERAAAGFGAAISAATDLLRALPRAAFKTFHVQGGGRLVPIDRLASSCDHFNLVAVPAARLDRLESAA